MSLPEVMWTMALVSPRGTPARRWLARLSFALAGAAVVILAVFARLARLASIRGDRPPAPAALAE